MNTYFLKESMNMIDFLPRIQKSGKQYDNKINHNIQKCFQCDDWRDKTTEEERYQRQRNKRCILI